MKGYQFLQNAFFATCRKRKITKLPMLLLIYLRGLYAYYGKPAFFYKDELLMKDLGITRNTLRQARGRLKEKGVIDFCTSSGRGKATRYLILETDLAPTLKGSEIDRKGSKFDPLSMRKKGQNLTPRINIKTKPIESPFVIASRPSYSPRPTKQSPARSNMPDWLKEAAEHLRRKREAHD